MKEVYDAHHYILDPHGAVGYLGMKAYQEKHPGVTGIFAETAHPAKFKETVEETLGVSIDIPARLAEYARCEKVTLKLSPQFEDLKTYLLSLSVPIRNYRD